MARLLSKPDEQRIVDAIRAAEAGSRGEVRVHLERRCPGDALARARELFGRLGMARTAADTGVLLYVAPGSRRAALWAGRGIPEAAGEPAWQALSDAVARGFSAGEGTSAIVEALGGIGRLLAAHLPGDPAGNELPDQVTTS